MNSRSQAKGILILGAKGQLGQALQIEAKAYTDLRFYYADREELDIRESGALESFLKQESEDLNLNLVINCAGYTQVDRAEEEQDLAYAINHLGVRELARSCKNLDLMLIHLSTDYVFSGTGTVAYAESDEAKPLNVYGKSKVLGEKDLHTILGNQGLVLRTAWLYSEYGKNFALKILALAGERAELSVVSDQIGSPTYAPHLAETLLHISRLACAEGQFRAECLHYTDEAEVSWFDLARELIRQAQLPCEVKPISSAEYPTLALRPRYSVLSKDLVRSIYNIEIKPWTLGVQSLINKLDI